MFSWFARLVLVATALAPVCLVYAWVLYAEGYTGYSVAAVLFATALVISAWLLLSAASRNLERTKFKPVSVEAADRESMGFMLLYLSPLFTAQFGALNLNILVPTILVFGLMTITGYNYHFNPLLGLFGWHFYKVTSEGGITYVLVTRKQLRKSGEVSQVGQLTEYILIDLEE